MNPSPKHFTLYPLIWLAASFAAGIAISQFSAIPLLPLAMLALITAAISLLFPKHSEFLLAAAFLLLGVFCSEIESHSVAPHRVKAMLEDGRIASRQPIVIEGVLKGLPEPALEGSFLRISVKTVHFNGDAEKASGTVRLFVKAETEQANEEYRKLNLRYGTKIRVPAALEREDQFLNPGVMLRTKILDQQGIDAVATVKNPGMVERLGDEEVFLPLAWIAEQRVRLIHSFRENFSPATAGVLIASLLGDKYFLDKNTAEVFREGGTFHVLVISGLHITFIGAIALLLVRVFTRKRLWQFLIAAVFLWGYTFAVGAEVPVMRATLMFTILAFSHVIHRTGSLLNSLGLCALLLLAWRPSDLFTTSFQLTFASVIAIVAVSFPLITRLREIGSWTPTADAPFPPDVPGWLRRFCETLYWRERIWTIETGRQIWSARLFKSSYLPRIDDTFLQSCLAYVFEGVLVSVVVQIWLLPLLVIYFHRVTPGSVILNLWVGSFIAIESIAGVLSIAASHVSSTLALPLTYAAEIANQLITSVPSLIVGSELIGMRVPNYSGGLKLIYAIYYLPLVIISFIVFRWNPFDWVKNRRNAFGPAAVALSVLGLIIVFHPYSSPRANGRLTVEFLDVGQGDAALITFPSGQTMLVDGGGRHNFRRDNETGTQNFEPDAFSIGESVVSPFLWERGYSKIDYILGTHADADHIQGLTAVAENFSLGHALFGRMPTDDRDFVELRSILDKKGVEAALLSQGDRINIDGVDVDVLYPGPDESAIPISNNNNSVVIKLTFGSRSVLLTGDIEARTENVLAGSPSLSADVIKVPHHGSRTSSTAAFVSAVQPYIAVISVGRHSMFGHPHPEVVERWKAAGAEVVTTGRKGTVTISTDGRDLQLSTHLQ